MENTNWDQIKNALCYIPIVAIVLYFIEQNKTKTLEKHIRYWIVLFVWYSILTILVSWFFMWFIVLAYMWASVFLWYKAYLWEDVQISFIDNFFEKKTNNNSNTKKTTEEKKEESKEKKTDDDVLDF